MTAGSVAAVARVGRRTVVVVVVLGVLLSLSVAWRSDVRAREQAQGRLASEADRATASVAAELRRHIEVARAAAAIVGPQLPVDQDTWTAVAERLRIGQDYPALFAFNQSVAARDREALARLEQQTGVTMTPPDPEGERDGYAVITTVYPIEGNAAALGFDMFVNGVAREASAEAVRAGELRLSDGLRLVQETEDQVAIVGYEPVRASDGATLGWISAVIRGQDFLDGVVAPPDRVRLVVSDETAAGEVVVLGRLPSGAVGGDSRLDPEVRTNEAFGQTWTLEFAAAPGFLTTTERQAPWRNLVTGLALTFATAAVLRGAGDREDRARELAAERTIELSAANVRLRRANVELERASRAKDDFLAVVSHEFRTPLTVIRGFATTLLEYRADELDGPTTDALVRIDANAGRLDGLVDDLLLAAKLESGQLDPDPRPVDVERLVRATIDDVGVTVPVELDVAPGTRALVDHDHLARILENFLTNAVKYGAPPIEVSAWRDGAEVLVEVRDHGPGVPEPLRERLFDRFAQAESGNARTTRGVGLGLAIVSDLCRVNGGRARYVPGDDGATFQVTLPDADVAPGEAPGDEVVASPGESVDR